MISFCVPVHNEEQILVSNLKKIQKGLSNIFGQGNYEIIIIENGSSDSTVNILKKIKEKDVHVVYAEKKGHGIAYKMGIEHAKGDIIVLSAIDLPFGFSDIIEAKQYWDTYDIIFGSKAHPKSQVQVSLKRKISSFVYRSLLRLLFHTNIRDTQGSVFLKKTAATKIIPYCTVENAFFTAQIAIYGKAFNLKMKEVAVVYDAVTATVRKSKYNIIKDGRIMLYSIVREYGLVRKIKKTAEVYVINKYRFLYVSLLIITLSIISYGRALDYNFWRDDWTALWLWKFHTFYYFSNWTFSSRHPGEFLNLYPWALLFQTNHYAWQSLGLLLKIVASFCVGLAAYGFTRSKKTAAIAALLYASYFGGLEAFTWLSAHLSTDLIILLCVTFYLYTESFRKNEKKLFILFLLVLFISTIIEPTRILFSLPLFIVWEGSERYVKQRVTIKKFGLRVVTMLAAFLAGLIITPIGRTVLTLRGSGVYTNAVIGHQSTISVFFNSIGNLLTIYLKYFTYSDAAWVFIASNSVLIGVFFLVSMITLGLFLIIRKNPRGPFVLLAALWIPCVYFPSWLAETTLTVDTFHRYLSLSGVGLIFILAYFLNKLGTNKLIPVLLILISINLYQSILTVNDIYNIRGYAITQRLYDIQDQEVPQNFTGGLFRVEGNNGLRGSAFDWSLDGTIPFALKRNISKFDLVPATGGSLELTEKFLCEKNIARPTITTWIMQKQPIPLSKVYAWRVTDDGNLENISSEFRTTLMQHAPCLQSNVHQKS